MSIVLHHKKVYSSFSCQLFCHTILKLHVYHRGKKMKLKFTNKGGYDSSTQYVHIKFQRRLCHRIIES